MEPVEVRSANAFRLSLEAGHIVIDFGNTLDAASGAAGVSVSDRVSLPIHTGRRLLHWLNRSVERHAAFLRAEAAKALPPEQAAAAMRPGQDSVRPQIEEAGERGAELLRLVGNLGVPYHYERSFRISERNLAANRFLLTIGLNNIPGDRRARILEILDRLDMPKATRDAAEANFARAKCIHFGFEADSGGIVCKLYLERSVSREEAQRARDDDQAVLLHLAYKWDLMKGTAVTTRYCWRPGLSAAAIEERLAHVYQGGPQTSFEIAKAVLALTKGRIATEMLQYLEVEEAENNRRSFDLNLYDAKLQVKDIQHLLNGMREHFGVRPGRMQALFDQIKTKSLGHLAGGVHRAGEDFFNVYYGVVELPHFHGGFQ
jgi:hypothetical protein